MITIAYAVASFLSFFPPFFRVIVIGAFAVVALWLILKLVIAVMDAIPFL